MKCKALLFFLLSITGIVLFASTYAISADVLRNTPIGVTGTLRNGAERQSSGAETVNIKKPASWKSDKIQNDFSIQVIEKVIRQKQIQRSGVNRWSAIACSRVIVENDTSVVSIREQVSDLLWDHAGGLRTELKYQNNMGNFREDFFEEFIAKPVDISEDEILLDGYRFVGPIGHEALKTYNFRVLEQRRTDSGQEINIAFSPKNNHRPAFVGIITILDSLFTVKSILVKTNRPLRLSGSLIRQENYIRWIPPQDRELSLSLEQNFKDYGGRRFPEDIKAIACEKIRSPGLDIPSIRYCVMIRFTQGVVSPLDTNILSVDEYTPSPLIGSGKFSLPEDEQHWHELLSGVLGPLPGLEQSSFHTSTEHPDSSRTLEEAFRSTGFLTHFGRVIYKKGELHPKFEWRPDGSLTRFLLKFTPSAEYNRVDGLNTGLSFKTGIDRTDVGVAGTYLQGQKRWTSSGEAEYRLGVHRNVRLAFSWLNGSQPISPVWNHSLYANSLRVLLGRPDYYNYFWNDRRNLTVGYRFSNMAVDLSAGFNDEYHSSLRKSSNEIFPGILKKQPENPVVDEGRLRSLVLAVVLGKKPLSYHSALSPWAEFNLEHAKSGFFGGDFSFTRFSGSLAWRCTTFFRNEYTPNTLDLQFLGGISSGNLPIQRFGIVGGGRWTNGLFRTFGGRTLEGEQYFALAMQHNFGSVPFDHLGWRFFSDNGTEFALHGAIGRSWVAKDRLPQLSHPSVLLQSSQRIRFLSRPSFPLLQARCYQTA